jgi:hypothetical protein
MKVLKTFIRGFKMLVIGASIITTFMGIMLAFIWLLDHYLIAAVILAIVVFSLLFGYLDHQA